MARQVDYYTVRMSHDQDEQGEESHLDQPVMESVLWIKR